MNESVFMYKPVGIIRTPFKQQEGTPIQASMASEANGSIEVFPEFVEGLLDIEGFSHLHLIYPFHQIKQGALKVIPYLDVVEHGIFATRAPKRPNPIGISVIQLLSVSGNILKIKGVDMLDGTPILDIKPYIPSLDQYQTEKIGWYKNRLKKNEAVLADNRFDSHRNKP